MFPRYLAAEKILRQGTWREEVQGKMDALRKSPFGDEI